MAGLDLNTKFLSHFEGNDGDKQFIDSGNTIHVVTPNGTAQLINPSKFGNTGLFLDGNSDYLSIPDSTDWDIFATTTESWTIDLFVKHDDHIGTETYIGQEENSGNRWRILHADGFGVAFQFVSGGVEIFSILGDEITDSNFHHIAIVKVADEYGIYVDGVQSAYIQDTTTDTFAGALEIGRRATNTQFFDGNMDEIRIEKSNPFSASPNVGLTDTITIPTSEHTSNANTHLLLHLESHDISGDGGSGNYHGLSFLSSAEIDTAQMQFGSASLLVSGSAGNRVLIDNPSDLDVIGSLLDDWTIDFWWYKLSATGTSFLFEMSSSDNNDDLSLDFTHSTSEFTLFLKTNGGLGDIITEQFILALANDTWHHIAFIKKADEISLYINGVQKVFNTFTTTYDTLNNDFFGVGSAGFTSGNAKGNIDEFRIQNSNDFGASPNVGLTDTITVPTQEYSVSVAPSDDEIRFNKFLKTHENIRDTANDWNFDKFTGRHYKNYDKK